MGNGTRRPPNIVVILAVVASALAAAILFRTGAPAPALRGAGDGKVTVVASFYPMYFFAQRIGGEDAAVANVTPAGAEPHDYEPTAQDVARMEDSRMVVLMGQGLEAWGDDITRNVDPRRTLVVVAGEGLMTGRMEEDGETVADPHVWLSPPLAKLLVEKIEAGYEKIDPARASSYRARADALRAELDELDAAYRQGLQDCARKDIITSHAAFGYLAAAYGLSQVSISGLSPDAEPSSKDMAKVAEFAKAHGVKYIFFESLVSPRLSDTIAEEVGAETLVLDPIEGITQDDLASGRDYVSVMRENLANLRTALQCTR